jgi:hypothetical protein
MSRNVTKTRPETFTLNRQHYLHKGLVFAGLGAHAGSTRYHDSSAYGNTGTLTNMNPATDWKSDRSLSRQILNFGGTNQHVAVSPAPITNAADAVTLCCWVKVLASVTNEFVFALGNSADSNPVAALVVEADNMARAFHRGSTGSESWYTASGAIALNSWYHWALTIKGSNYRAFYINGAMTASSPNTVNIGAVSVNRMGIGCLIRSAPDLYANVEVADAMAYARCLSSPEIQFLADPSNVMLSGLIKPPRRKWWPVVAGGTPAAFKAYWAGQATKVAV